MKRRGRILAVVIGVACLALAWVALNRVPADQANASTVPLQSPGNARVALDGFLVADAGIAAWAHISQTIRLDYVKLAFRVVEDQTEDYLIGSVAVPGYDIAYDPHVYVHKDGWMVAYYSPSTRVSKILDWQHRTLGTTTLERVLDKVMAQDGITLEGVEYCHFQYPDATHLLYVRKDNNGSFQINIPTAFDVIERSWLVAGFYCSYVMHVYYRLDGATLAYLDGFGWQVKRGTLAETQLLPDLSHTFQVSVENADAFSVLVLLYADPGAAN